MFGEEQSTESTHRYYFFFFTACYQQTAWTAFLSSEDLK